MSEAEYAAVVARLDTPLGLMTVANTHLSFVPGWNALQLRRLVRELRARGGRVVLMGDLNMQAGQAVRVSGLQPLAPATTPTFPVEEPTRQLDHVLGRGPIRATGPAEAVRLPLSDHRALVVPCASP